MNKNILTRIAAGYPKLALLFLAIALPCLLSGQVGITYSLQGIGFSLEEGDVHYSFDVMARASASGTAIGTGIFYLEYSSPAFGSWINANGGLEVLQGELTTHPYFNFGLYANDTSANVLAVTFEYQGIEGYGNALPETDTQLARIKLRMQDIAQPAQIAFWPDQLSPAWQNLMEGQQFYDDNATVYDPVLIDGGGLDDLFVPSVQTIGLQAGWNLVSFWVLPLNADPGAVFADVIGAGKLIKIQNEGGESYIEDIGGIWNNSIGDLLPEEGYYVKVNSACDFIVSGCSITLPMSVGLQNGWNILPYPYASEQPAMSVLQPLIDAEVLVKVQDEQGNSIVQDYDGIWHDSIGIFASGKAYNINVSANTQLTFESFSGKKAEGKR